MTRRKLLLNMLAAMAVIAVAGSVGAYMYNASRCPVTGAAADARAKQAPAPDGTQPVRISAEARKNLGITSKAVQPVTYWKKIEVPGVITDRPGISDRGVVAPVTGVVTQIHAYPGDSVAPAELLFSMRLISEQLHTSQLELYKATKEIEILRQQRKRLEELVKAGGVTGSRLIDIDNQIQRMEVNVQAYRQDLAARGLPQDRIDDAAKGDFAAEILIRAPTEQAIKESETAQGTTPGGKPQRAPFSFELQTLKVELGQQVEAGEVMCSLADHRSLLIEGRGFKKDMPLIGRAARNQFPIEVAFEIEEGAEWPPLPRELRIHHLANLIDTQSRTFAFNLQLQNEWQAYKQNDQDRLIWRFRPGDRVRLSVAVEKMDDVFVAPIAAVVREGPEAFVFRQNGDLFDRIPVHVLHEDSSMIVIANDGAVREGAYIAQNGAASLNRVLKAQVASGVPANLHVHADGTVHGAH